MTASTDATARASSDDRYATCDGRELLLEWRIHSHIFTSFEIDYDAVTPLVPDALEVVELRPGVAVFSVGVLSYESDHFYEGSPEFDELVSAVHVAPDLSVKMPMPTMSFFATQVYCNSPDFVEQEGRTIFTPSEHVPSLKVAYSDQGWSADVSDGEGSIFSVKNVHPDPVFKDTEMWGQHFTNTKGLQQGIWEWDGRKFEHMKRNDDWTLHQHRAFGGVDVSAVKGLYRQMILEPSTRCMERFYGMRKL